MVRQLCNVETESSARIILNEMIIARLFAILHKNHVNSTHVKVLKYGDAEKTLPQATHGKSNQALRIIQPRDICPIRFLLSI